MKKYSRATFILPWLICSLGALFYAYEYFLRISPSLMTDQLLAHYQINYALLGNLFGLYYFAYTPMQLFVGILLDRFGPRRLLTTATLTCAIGSFLFALTTHFWVAAIGRLLIGFGSAFAYVGVLKLATIWLPRRYFAMFSGIATAIGMLGAIAGDIVLTKMIQAIGWENTIYISAFLGSVLALLIVLFVREQSLSRKKIQATQVTNIRDAFLGLIEMARTSQMWITGIIGGLLYTPITAFAESWGVPYLQQTHNLRPEQAGIAISMVFLGWVFGGPVAGLISDLIKRRNTLLTINPLIAAVLITFVLIFPHVHRYIVYSLLFIFGLFTSAQVLVFAIARENNSSRLAATALAFVNMAVMLSGVIFQPAIGLILNLFWNGKPITQQYAFSASAYDIALSILPIALVIAALLAKFALQETSCKQYGKIISR